MRNYISRNKMGLTVYRIFITWKLKFAEIHVVSDLMGVATAPIHSVLIARLRRHKSRYNIS